MISGTWKPVASLEEKRSIENEVRLLMDEQDRLISSDTELLESHFRRLEYIRTRLSDLGIFTINRPEISTKETIMIQLVRPESEEKKVLDLAVMKPRTKKRKVSAILRANKDRDQDLIAEICDVAAGDVILWTPQAWAKLLSDLEKCPDTLEEFALKNQPVEPIE